MAQKTLRIYVAGPYTPKDCDLHDAVRVAHQNTLKAIEVGIQLINKKHVPFIPHLTHFIHLQTTEGFDAGFYRHYDMVWLKYCEALFFIGPIGSSEGAAMELKWAQEHGLLIFYDMNKVPTADDEAE